MGALAHIQSRCLISYDSIASRRIESKGSKWPRCFKSHDSTLLPLSSMCSSQSNTHIQVTADDSITFLLHKERCGSSETLHIPSGY